PCTAALPHTAALRLLRRRTRHPKAQWSRRLRCSGPQYLHSALSFPCPLDEPAFLSEAKTPSTLRPPDRHVTAVRSWNRTLHGNDVVVHIHANYFQVAHRH